MFDGKSYSLTFRYRQMTGISTSSMIDIKKLDNAWTDKEITENWPIYAVVIYTFNDNVVWQIKP